MAWDVDGNGNIDALTDGLLVLRYLFGLRGEALIDNSLGPDATRTGTAPIIAYLESISDQLDVDGNGAIDALTDGLLNLRYLFGFRGESLTRGAVGAGATRSTAEQIVAYLESIASPDPKPIDPDELRTIEENNALDLQMAIDRAVDLSSDIGVEADLRYLLWFISSKNVGSSNWENLGFEKIRQIGNNPNNYILQIPEDLGNIEAFRKLNSNPEIEFAYPLVPIEIELDYIPNDPLFPDQWHLKNTGQNTGQTAGTPGVDANLEVAWDIPVPGNPPENVRGRDVVIGIVDDALQGDHPDIVDRYIEDLSNDFFNQNVNDRDPSPDSPSENHGTAVAGVAAATGNNKRGVTGVAPEAGLAGIRLIGGSSITEDQIYDALGWQDREIDIYQSSWSPSNFRGQDPLILERIQEGIANGRDGKGSIYVHSAGNNREPRAQSLNPLGGDNVNYNGLANSRHTIAVGAIDHNGEHAPYSEPGAPLLVSAPSSSNIPPNTSLVVGGITTTDLVGSGNITDDYEDEFGNTSDDYRDDFGGTSAAAPVVSGVIALMLEANPELSWRDVQHILVQTAEQNDPNDSDWVINGAGYHVNHLYGFGSIDAAAAVETAIGWTPVDPELLIVKEFTPGEEGWEIPDNEEEGVERTVTFNSDINVEWAEVVFKATHPRRGDWEVVLISPDGTESILAELRDDDNANYNWNFTSARHWGESSAGEWRLQVSDLSSGETGTVDFAELRLYGTVDRAVNPNQPVIAVDDVAFSQLNRHSDEGNQVEIDVLANDVDLDGDELVVTGVSDPGNGTTDLSSNNQIVYIPAANFVGTDSFSYTIDDGEDNTDSATVTVTVEPANQAPIAVDDLAATTEGGTIRITVLDNDFDPDNDAIEILGVRLAASKCTVYVDGDDLVYSPEEDFTGTDSFTYVISDGEFTSEATVTVTVEPNLPPIAEDDVATTTENIPVRIAVLENDSDPDGDIIEIVGFSETSVNEGTIAIDENELVYSPDFEFTGTDSFTYTISDGQLNDTATVTVTVEENSGPAIDDVATTTENIAVSIPVLDNDLAPNGEAIEIVGFSEVSVNEGTIVIDENELVYSPDFEFTGTDSFTYTISDGQLTDTATVTVTVEPVNPPPMGAVDDVATTTENIAVSIKVLDNDFDPDGDSISIVGFSEVSVNEGTIVIDDNGTPLDASDDCLVYIPANDFTGTDSFRYTISDGQDTSSATVTVTVESTGGLGSIGGVKFFDSNQDGIRDPGEQTLAGWTIFLDTNNDGVLNNNEQSTVTGVNGSYFFGNLSAGTYSVGEIQQPGFQSTSPNPVTVVLAAGENRTGVNFGNVSGSISGVKFFDANENGIRDAGEQGIAGCTIFLDANNDGVLNSNEQSTVTGANGSYAFGNLSAGTYNVRVIPQAGFELTPENPVTIVLAAGEDRTGVNFGQANVTTVIGNTGVVDTFFLGTETKFIEGFVDGEDVLTLPDSLTFSQLQIAQGTGSNSENTEILLASSDQLIATLVGVQASVITVADFVEAADLNLIVGNNNLTSLGEEQERLNGGEGNDTLIGNRGADILFGGAGADVFLYNSLADSGADPEAPSEGVDRILDFSPAEDTIRLNFEVAPGIPVSIEDVEIADFISFGLATIGLNTPKTEPDFLTDRFSISLNGIATTTTSEEILDSIQFGPL